ncbi:unnamed protein product, partial [Effrenium voratum]
MRLSGALEVAASGLGANFAGRRPNPTNQSRLDELEEVFVELVRRSHSLPLPQNLLTYMDSSMGHSEAWPSVVPAQGRGPKAMKRPATAVLAKKPASK